MEGTVKIHKRQMTNLKVCGECVLLKREYWSTVCWESAVDLRWLKHEFPKLTLLLSSGKIMKPVPLSLLH
jgi:hypothetical protein